MIVLENKSHDQISQGAFEIVVDSSDISFRATFESPATATTFQVYSCSNLPYWQLNSPSLFLDHVTLGYHPNHIPSRANDLGRSGRRLGHKASHQGVGQVVHHFSTPES